jgi:hypothetical protein
MSGRGRWIAFLLVALALVLSAGRWGSVFLTERLWEATVSEGVAIAGARRALLGLALEFSVLAVATLWFVFNLTIAARAALPDRAPPEREGAKLWPAQLPRWSLTVLGMLAGALFGGGAGSWLDELLLTMDGVRFGIPDPLLGADLGLFLRDVPLWIHAQSRLATFAIVALVMTLALHVAGGAVRIVNRRLWISPKVRGHLAVLLVVLALSLAWGRSLEPFRLAAGLRGPMLSSEFLLRTLVAELQGGLSLAAGVTSLFWWLRLRGSIVGIVWLVLGLSLLGGEVLPLRTEVAASDEGWQAAARRLDSVAYALGEAEGPAPVVKVSAAALAPSLWDEPQVATVADSGAVAGVGRGWVQAGSVPDAVWFAVRTVQGLPPALLALSDDQASSTGGLLAWGEGDSAPSPGLQPYRELSPHALRPGAPAVDVATEARGVALDSWPRRMILAWALQVPAALSSPSGSRLAWRLDPGVRLRSVAPFAHWSPARARLLEGSLVWTSEGLLTSDLFPSSSRIVVNAGTVSMVRPAFLGVVDATVGTVRIFRREAGDSLAAAYGRIAEPLIEAPDAIPAELRRGEAYPEELLLAQARALEGPAWRAGRMERSPDGSGVLPPSAIGAAEVLVPFIHEGSREIRAFLYARRTASGDSVRFFRLDSLHTVESSAALIQRWEQFPFQQMIRDSVRAAGASFETGRVRHVVASDGIAAYQPAWAVSSFGRVQLVMVNVALDRRLGTGRSVAEAWKNLHGQMSPITAGAGVQAVLEEARKWMRHADSALKRGDLPELGRALAYLHDLLEPTGNR